MTARKPPPVSSPYQVHPGVPHAQAMVANLPEKTGRDLAAWLALLGSAGARTSQQAAAWLQRTHGLGRGTAVLLAEIAEPGGAVRIDDEAYLAAAAGYVEAQYQGPRAHLRPILERVVERGRALGGDVRVCPGKTLVPLYRSHVIAHVRATTQRRVDLGLALRGTARVLGPRVLATGGGEKGDRITHRIGLASVDEVDAEVVSWLQEAYRLDA